MTKYILLLILLSTGCIKFSFNPDDDFCGDEPDTHWVNSEDYISLYKETLYMFF